MSGTGTSKNDPSDDDDEQKAWDHFCQTVKLSNKTRDFLQENEVVSLETFYAFFLEILEEQQQPPQQQEGGATAAATTARIRFDFDQDNKISFVSRARLRSAWDWLNDHKALICDAKGFCCQFDALFYTKTLENAEKRKRLQEVQQEEVERIRKRTHYDLETKSSRMSASSFTSDSKHLLEGVGTSPPQPYDHLIPFHVRALFLKLVGCRQVNATKDAGGGGGAGESSDDSIRTITNFFRDRGDGYNLKSMGETLDPRSAKKEILDDLVNTNVFRNRITTERVYNDDPPIGPTARTLKHLGLGDGVSTSGSPLDGFFHTKSFSMGELGDREVDFLVTGIVECKGSESSPFHGTGEGVSLASNAAVGLFKVGIPIDQIVIPIVSFTGSLFQFAAVYLLEPCFPAVCFLTHPLRSALKNDCENIAAHLCAMRDFTIQLEGYIADAHKATGLVRRESVKMLLSPETYHFKTMDRFFTCFTNDASKEISMNHYLRVTERLKGSDAVCLPLTIRLGETKGGNKSEDIIVFSMLTGYKIGFPDKAEDRVSLLEAICTAVSDVHALGVIHMDLYLSNIMWKKLDDGRFHVKLIDFDAAQLKEDKVLTNAVVERLVQNEEGLFQWCGVAPAEHYDEVYLNMFRKHLDDTDLRVAQNEDERAKEGLLKERLDQRCTQLKREFFPQYKVHLQSKQSAQSF